MWTRDIGVRAMGIVKAKAVELAMLYPPLPAITKQLSKTPGPKAHIPSLP